MQLVGALPTALLDSKLTDNWVSAEILKGVHSNKNLGVTDECLLLFGNGDGGGGPTPKMLEKVCLVCLLFREADLVSLNASARWPITTLRSRR